MAADDDLNAGRSRIEIDLIQIMNRLNRFQQDFD
jgi:hypothetical protein